MPLFPTRMPACHDPLWPNLDWRKRVLVGRIELILDDLERPLSSGELLAWIRGVSKPTADELSYVLRVMERCGYLEQIEVEETRTFCGGKAFTTKSKMWRVKT
jgi:hypothetical protein